jgi:cation transport ATPase
MKIKNLIILLSTIAIFTSCSNFLHVEKRQYRKGLYVEKLFPFAEKKLKTSLSEDSLHNKNTQEIETLEDYLLSDNTVNKNPEILCEERDNIRFSTIKTAVQNPKEQTKEQKNSKPKIQDDDPDKEGKKQKRDTLDTLIIAFSVLSIIIVFFLPIPLMLAAFSIRRKRRGKSKKDKRWTVAKILLGAAIFVALPVLMAVFLIYSAGFLVWYTFPVFLGLYALLLLAIIYWPWPKYEKTEKKRNESQ